MGEGGTAIKDGEKPTSTRSGTDELPHSGGGSDGDNSAFKLCGVTPGVAASLGDEAVHSCEAMTLFGDATRSSFDGGGDAMAGGPDGGCSGGGVSLGGGTKCTDGGGGAPSEDGAPNEGCKPCEDCEPACGAITAACGEVTSASGKITIACGEITSACAEIAASCIVGGSAGGCMHGR